MILIPHILAGAMIGAKTQNLGLIVVLGLIIHFIMDWIPHWDYFCRGIKDFSTTRNFKALFFDFFKIAIEGLIGLLIVFLILWQKNLLNIHYLPFILFGIFVSVLPDISLVFSLVFLPEKISKKYFAFHEKYLHFRHKEKEGKITFLGLATEIIITMVALFFLFY